MFNLQHYLETQKIVVEHALDQQLPPADTPPAVLHEAMRYSALAGGKRLRPILCIASAHAVNGNPADALLPGLAIEILHTYTLIHDDLPSMDDDDLRRGKPTCHTVYGEANAILAGDALLTLAFQWLAQSNVPPPYGPHHLVLELTQATGSQGVIAGQIEDMAAEGTTPTRENIDYIHTHKTAKLIQASCRMGGIAGGAPTEQIEALSQYGLDIGLAFQIADDILNATSTPEHLGKATGSDHERGKSTYVALMGIDDARHEAQRLIEQAITALDHLPGPTDPLKGLAELCLHRTH